MAHRHTTTATTHISDSKEPATAFVETPEGTVKVSCYITMQGGYPRINASHPTTAPAPSYIGFLSSKKLRDYATQYRGYTIQDCVYYTRGNIPFEEWQDAIVNEIVSRFKPTTHSPTETTVLDSATYLAAGGVIYKLQPVEVPTVNRALRVMRRRVADQTKAEVDRIIAAANASSAATLAEANKRLAEARTYLDKAKVIVPPPQWAMDSNIPLMFRTYDRNSRWLVRFEFWVKILHWDYTWEQRRTGKNGTENYITHKSWKALPADPFRVAAWVPLEDDKGSYNPRNTFLDKITCLSLPHMNSNSGACLSLASGPEFIKGLQDLNNLGSAISHCFEGVDCNSLWTDPSYWPPTVWAFCPKPIIDELKRNNFSALTKIKADTEKELDQIKENKETWQAA